MTVSNPVSKPVPAPIASSLEDQGHVCLRTQLECSTDRRWLEQHAAFGAESLRIEISTQFSLWAANALDLPAIDQVERFSDLMSLVDGYVAALDIEQTAKGRLRAIAAANPTVLAPYQIPGSLAPITPGPSTMRLGLKRLLARGGD